MKEKGALSFRDSDSGSIAIEFALLSPVVFFMMLSIVEFGIFYADSSSIQTGTFALAHAIQMSTTPPADVATAKSIILNSCIIPHSAGDLIISVSTVPTTPVTAANMPAQPTADSYALPATSQPVVIRVVAKRAAQTSLAFQGVNFWAKMFAGAIDYSVVAVTQGN